MIMKKILLAVAMACALVSCSTDELSNGGSTAPSKGVELVLSTDGFNEVSTRGTVAESLIKDVNILEYANGTCSKIIYLTNASNDFSKAVALTGLNNLPATTMKNATDADGNTIQVMSEDGKENFVYVIANYGSQINSEDVSSLDKLKTLKLEYSGNKDKTTVPMTGYYYGGINSTTTTQMNVTLQRAVAKINFTLDTKNFTVGGKTPSQIIVNSIKLCNVPKNITLYPCNVRPSLPKNNVAGVWNGDQTPFPTESEMASSVNYSVDDNQSATANNFVAYIPENARGSYDTQITSNEKKRPSTLGVSENNDKSYTYILVDLNYMKADGSEKRATYKIYLGGNSTGDMNLLRNTQYNVSTSLYGANTADTRISASDVFTPGTVPSDALDAANCYIVSGGSAKSIIIPLAQARKGWSWIANQTKNATDAAALTALDNALTSGNYTIEQVWSSSSTPITGAKNGSNSKFATVTIPAGVANGNNAVIALKIGGKIYWSWHLWITDYDPATNNQKYAGAAFQAGGRYQNKKIMDRNLGATITGKPLINAQPSVADAPKYYGLFYQYGRKDPFLPADGTSIGDNKTQISVSGTATHVTASATSLATTVQNPTEFYAGGPEWNNELPTNTDFWSANGVKSAFDPCPPGWRVPSSSDVYSNPWAGFADGDFNNVSNTLNDATTPFGWLPMSGTTKQNAVNSGRLYSKNGVSSWYPASGNRNSGSGAIYSVGYNGYCWSATSGRYLGFNSSGVYPVNSRNRSYGFPVRCVQE